MGLGIEFERIGWRSIVAVDYLQRMLWRVRPYEKEKGASDKLFDIYIKKFAERIRLKLKYIDLIKQASMDYKELINPNLPRRPIIGINGEIYLRSNAFSNKNLVKVCEDAGLEVVVSPMGEWMKYVSHRNLEDALKVKNVRKIIRGYIRKIVQERDEFNIAKYYEEVLKEREPSTKEILAKSSLYLSPRCGSEAVLSIGSGIDWMENPRFAGVISVMPHGCMPGGIVAAMADKFSAKYYKPWINLTYDGFLETNNSTKINEFAELVKFCIQNNGRFK
jgi:predicted nucleotide-binding protein (sugar kinase/HSP70/actin superfamily)